MEKLELLYIPEHLQCANYASDANPVVELVGTDVDDIVERDTTYTAIVYIMQGAADLSWEDIKDYTLAENEFMLFPPGTRLTAKIKAPSEGIILRLNDSVNLCDKYTLENLYHDQDVSNIRHTHLKANAIVKAYMELLAENVKNGLRCTRYLEMKVNEMFYYLRAYYPKEELAGFNLPMLSDNARFMDFVWRNYRQVHDVAQFAALANSSPEAFRKKFKRIVRIPAKKWLSEHRIMNAYHDICIGKESLKEISEKCGFASVSHMGESIKGKFGISPAQIRASSE